MADTKVRYGQSTGGVGVASNGTTLVDVYTFGSALVAPDGASGPGGVVDAIRVYNSDTVAHLVELHNVPNGDAAGDDTMFERVLLQPDELYRYRGPERGLSLAKIQMRLGEAHTATAVYAKPEISEFYV